MYDKMNNKGFSLVEIIIAIGIGAIITSALIAFMTYSSNSMAETQAKVELQNEAKNIINHISTICMEASEAEWVGPDLDILLVKNKTATIPEREEVIYWRIGTNLYFASTSEVNIAALPANSDFLLGDWVEEFIGTIEENPESKKKIVQVNVKLTNSKVTFECNNSIFIRNQ